MAIGTLVPVLGTSAQMDDEYFSQYSFDKWKSQNSDRPKGVDEFNDYLRHNKVYGVIPTFQIMRTASMAQECNADGFEIPPHKFWPNILKTLDFIEHHIKPEIGAVEAVSGYRNPVLNKCANGARRSSHAQYFALDLVPVEEIKRDELIRRVCLAHIQNGVKYNIGLGFYNHTRFHIDSRSFRRWGPNGRGRTSPCVIWDKYAIKVLDVELEE